MSRVKKKKVCDILPDHDAIRIEIVAWKKQPGINLIAIDQDRRADLVLNFAKVIPFPDDTVSLICKSHLLGRLAFWEHELLLRDCLRALKPRGALSMCVPNARLHAEAFLNGAIIPPPGRQCSPKTGDVNSAIEKLNLIAYIRARYNYVLDKENLVNLLARFGFDAPRLRGYYAQVDIAVRGSEPIYLLGIKCDNALSVSAVALSG